MPMAQQQQQQQQQPQQYQCKFQQRDERLNPEAPMWMPKGGNAIPMPTTTFPPFYAFDPVMPFYCGIGPVIPPVRPVAGYSLFSYNHGTGDQFPLPEQHPWADAKRSYFSSFHNFYRNNQPQYGTERRGYADVSPPTLPFFPSGPYMRTNKTVVDTLGSTSVLTRRGVMCHSPLPTETREDMPQTICRVKEKVDLQSMEDWHRCLSESCLLCLLCGGEGHRYTACRLFDGKSVCFVHVLTSCVYVMHHMQWIEGAKLRDVYYFIQNAMALSSGEVVLYVGSQTITSTKYSPDTRCCDLQLLPGAIVGVSHPKLSVGEKLPLSVEEEISLIGKSVQEVQPAGEKVAHTDVTFDVSTIAKSSELSVSIPMLERRIEHSLENTMEAISDSLSLTNKGDNSDSGIARASNEDERGPMSIGERTAVPSPQTSENGMVDSDGRDLTLATGSSLTSTVPLPDVTTGIAFRVNSPMQSTLCGDSGPLDWADVPSDDTCCGVEGRATRVDPTKTVVAAKDAILTTPQVEDAAAEELRRRCTVHVKFIPVTMPFSAIRALLWSCGEVNKVRLVRPSATSHPERTFYVCFAEYADEAGAARMLALHGCRLLGNFILAVARSRDAIRGGFITDRDAGSGTPCSFGLNEAEMYRMGIPTTTPVAVRATATTVIPSSRETISLPRSPSLLKNCFPGLTTQEKREKDSTRSNIVHNDDSPSKGGEGDTGVDGGIGPYTLEIVATLEARKRQKRDLSLRTNGIEGSKNAPSTAPRTLPAMRPFPEVVSRETVRGAETLRTSLREAVLNHLKRRSSESSHNAFNTLEELRWSAASALLHLELTVFEVLLLLNQDSLILLKNLEKCAATAVRLGTELRQILQSVAASNSCIAPMWRSLFVTIPPAQQQEQEYGIVASAFEGVELQDSHSVSPIYPCLPNCLRFVELLLYIAVLLDSSHDKGALRCEEAKTKTRDAALVLPLPSYSNPLHDITSELLFSARRLLMQLEFEFSTKKEGSTSDRCTWGGKISAILQKIPSTSDWHDGNIIHLFSTDPRQGSQERWLEGVDFRLF